MPKLFACPKCGYTRSWIVRRYHRKCKRCRSEWSPFTHYPIKKFRLTGKEWRRIIYNFLRDGTIKAVSRECRLAYATAQKAVCLLRTAMQADAPTVFFDVCEADETYVGGAWKNKAIHIRRQGSKRGRGTSKQAIFGIVQRNPACVRIWLVPDCKGTTLRPIIHAHIIKGSSIYTDGHKGYRPLGRQGYHHDWVDHDAGEYVRGDVHTQNMDGYWGKLKTHLDSIGGIRKEQLPLFIGEYQWRYNARQLDRKEQTEKLYHSLVKFGGRF
jgi:transposase